MELNELKNIWRQQDIDHNREYSQSELMVLVNNKMLSLEKEIRSRDRLEIGACIIIVLFFGYIFFTSQSLWTQTGSAILVLSGAFIAYKLKAAQITKRDENMRYNHSMQKHLKSELKQVKRQKRLLENIVWWYIAPIVVGLLFFTIGFESGLITKFIYMAVVLAFSVFVWHLNQKAVQKKFDPLAREISEAIKSLQNDNN